jgi:hypothetical protein
LIGQQNDALAGGQSQGVVNPKTVAQYGHIYHKTAKKADGTACSVKVTSVKTWKTRPGEFEIGWKYGLREYGKITPQQCRRVDDHRAAAPFQPEKKTPMTAEQIVESMLGDDFDPKEYVQDLPTDPTLSEPGRIYHGLPGGRALVYER